jgi:hypothetical protein
VYSTLLPATCRPRGSRANVSRGVSHFGFSASLRKGLRCGDLRTSLSVPPIEDMHLASSLRTKLKASVSLRCGRVRVIARLPAFLRSGQ